MKAYKKIFLATVAGVIGLCMSASFVSCANDKPGYTFVTGDSEITVKNVTRNSINDIYVIVEVTYNGETHEYLQFDSGPQGGISHWEGCRYCKTK